jgi:hypothetical protein
MKKYLVSFKELHGCDYTMHAIIMKGCNTEAICLQ